MTSPSVPPAADPVLDALRRAVAVALDRKRRLGQYAEIWRDGRVARLEPHELPALDAPAPRP